MKITSKRLVSMMLVLAFALAMLPMAVFAETPSTLYLVPNSNWHIDGARFAAVLATDGWSAQVWVDAVDSDADGVYEVAVPDDGNAYSIVIFCRMNPNAAGNDWSNKWNQTSDLTIPTDGTNCYTVAGGTWDNGGGEWSTFTAGDVVDPEETPALEINSITAVGTGSGNFLYGIQWDPASSVNYAYEDAAGVYSVTYRGVAAGTYEFKFAANDGWNVSWGTGAECVSGETYDAYLGGGNSSVIVAEDNSTVTLTLDLSAIDEVGNGAKMSVLVEAPIALPESSAPEALVLGDNSFVIGNGDTNAITSTYTVEEAGVLVVNVTYMNMYDSYSNSWSEIPAAYIPMQFGRSYAVLVNGTQVWLPGEVEVAVGDVVEIGVQSYMGNAAEITVNLSMREPGVNDIKWQLNADASANSESVDLRLISWVDSLDYSSVDFVVTINGVQSTLKCTTVYNSINADGTVIEYASDLFGYMASYFVTYTIEGVPADYFNSEIEVTVVRTDLEGYASETETRTIVIADVL